MSGARTPTFGTRILVHVERIAKRAVAGDASVEGVDRERAPAALLKRLLSPRRRTTWPKR